MGGSREPGSEPTLRALLIGVSYYRQEALPGLIRYPSLPGAVGDVEGAETLLHERLGVPRESIRKLTSSPGGDECAEAPEDLPTYENMIRELKRLRDLAGPGDHILIHYSGHGGRTPTTVPRFKGEKGLDECLVPFDIVSPRARYLRDTEMNYLLRGLVDREAFVTLVVDCCHSGGTLRDGSPEGLAVRGIEEIDAAPRPGDSEVASWEELAESWQRSWTIWRGVHQERTWGTTSIGFALLAACRPQELAYEARFDGFRSGGALTHFFLEALRDGGAHLTYRHLYQRLLGKIQSRFVLQTPMLEGEADRLVFGREELPTFRGVPLLAGEEEEAGKVCLQAGRAHGVGPGARFVIFPPEVADPGRAERRLARVVVSAAGATSAWAAVEERFEAERPLGPGDQAVFLDPGPTPLRHAVWRVLGEGGRRCPGEEAAMARLEAALAQRDSGFLDLAGDGDVSHLFQVGVGQGGIYEIRDAVGKPLPNLRPEIPVGEPGAARRVVDRLIHLAKYRNVQRLENSDEASPLREGLEVALGRLPQGPQPGEPLASEPFDPGAKIPEVRVGDEVCLTVHNRSRWDLNVTVLDLQPGWGIEQVHPTPTRGSFEPLEAGHALRVRLIASLPEGYEEGLDVIKVFATVGPVNVRWLELPDLDRPLLRGEGSPRRPQGALEEYLAALAAEEPATRSARAPAELSGQWVVEELTVRVKR